MAPSPGHWGQATELGAACQKQGMMRRGRRGRAVDEGAIRASCGAGGWSFLPCGGCFIHVDVADACCRACLGAVLACDRRQAQTMSGRVQRHAGPCKRVDAVRCGCKKHELGSTASTAKKLGLKCKEWVDKAARWHVPPEVRGAHKCTMAWVDNAAEWHAPRKVR